MRVPWNRGGIRSYLIVLGLVGGHPSITSILVGVPPLLLGIALHLWAKGCLHQDQEVTTCGPYRYARHPFYLGNILIDLAVVIMSGSLLLAGVSPVWWALIYIPTMRREEAKMTRLYGEQYRWYAQRVPLLFPTTRPIPATSGFSWHNPNIAATEVPRTLRFLSYPFLFVLACRWHASALRFLSPLTPLTFGALLAVLSLNVLAWQSKRIARVANGPSPSDGSGPICGRPSFRRPSLWGAWSPASRGNRRAS